MFLGTSEILLKYGPVDLLVITKMLQKIQENYGIVLDNYYLCEYGTQNVLEKWKHETPSYRLFRVSIF